MSRTPARSRQSKPKKPARKAAPKRRRGRPTKFTPAIARAIIEGLSKGKPLTVICRPESMPSDRTVRDWAEKDPVFSAAIAGAREAGFDRIALDALAIADEVTDQDTIRFTRGEDVVELPNKEWIMRSKLRVETRLRLLAKWDPKRYGDKLTQEISGPGGGPIVTEGGLKVTPEDEQVIRRIVETRERVKQSREGE